MADYTRPASGFRFVYGTMNTINVADSLPDNQYPLLQNVRWYDDTYVRTRPGLSLYFTSGLNQVLGISGYSSIGTNNVDIFLASSSGNIYDNNGHIVDTGYSAINIPTMLPYRPNQSPQSWMYIADGTVYRKISAPTAGTYIAQNTGIVEPQAPVDAAITNEYDTFVNPSSIFTNTGTAGSVSAGVRNTDTVVAAFSDPASGVLLNSLQVGSTQYQTNQTITIHGEILNILDVFTPLPTTLPIQSIYYYSGTTGKCVVVPLGISSGPGNDEQSIYSESYIASIRRGALVEIGSEVCLVLDVTIGPDGTICFETSTTINHTASEKLSGVPAIQVLGGFPFAPGNSITQADALFSCTQGIGAIATSLPVPIFVDPGTGFSFQPDDYIHFSINIDNLDNLIEAKLTIDVNNGTADYVSNAYFYTVRPNDIVAGINNSLTQLGVAQIVAQREQIDEEAAAESNNQGNTSSSAQTATGDNQWSEILFPISALTRIGNDQTRTLSNAQGVQLLINCSGTVNVKFVAPNVFGGFQADVGDVGAPYQYIIRPRSSITGAKGNPCPIMRYGVNPRRQQVTVTLPATYPDPQVDTFDIFRFGGALTAYTFVGFVNVGNTSFIDNYSDDTISSSEQIEYDNYEPWPSVDQPATFTVSTLNGTVAVVSTVSSGPTPVTRFLPGNLVQINQQVYTLWTRPVQMGPNVFLFQFVENAGYLPPGSTANISEPNVARQLLPYMWGPDEFGGTIFAVGDTLRPGFVYFCKNFNPDSAPDSYNIELCPPSEPLLGGCLLNGNSYVFSTERCWFLRPSFGQDNQYTPQEVPTGRGLASPFGIDTDGKAIYFVSKDGIYSSDGGIAQNLTNDLYNIFPHEGIQQQPYSYNGISVFQPNYAEAANFRIKYVKGYLFFNYLSYDDNYHTLVYDLRHQVWCVDLYSDQMTVHYSVVNPEGSVPSPGTESTLMVMGSVSGKIYIQSEATNDNGVGIQCYVATREWTAGDERALKEWGDCSFDALPTNANPMVVTPMSLGSPIVGLTPTDFTGTVRYQQGIVNLGGDVFSFSFGLFISWLQTYEGSEVSPASLYVWEPAYLGKPETTANRFTDWDDAGVMGAKYMQGFILEFDSLGVNKSIGVRNGDDGVLQQSFVINRNGQGETAYSFTSPFVAHMVRIEPQDLLLWKYYNVRWVWEPTPETVTHWQTQPSSLDAQAYTHVKELEVAYASTSTVTFTMNYDSNSQVYTLPSTGGVYVKTYLILQANKGKLYSFVFDSSSRYQIWLDDFRVLCGGWGRSSAYESYAKFGGKRGDAAAI